jgi:RNA polymerase sigma factor (sigma-70 family)
MERASLNDRPAIRPEFRTTHWSVVLAAGSASAEQSNAALEALCRTYWHPLYAFVRREGYAVEEAQDLTQAFFARLLERRDLATVQQHKGRFRSYLLASLKNFLINEWHRARTVKRGGDRAFIPLDEILDEERLCAQPADNVTAESLFERRWALTLLETVLARLETEFAGDARVFQCWKRTLNDDAAPPLAATAAELGTNENALKQAFHRLRGRYRQLLREEVAHTVAQPGEIEDELRHLVRVLRS